MDVLRPLLIVWMHPSVLSSTPPRSTLPARTHLPFSTTSNIAKPAHDGAGAHERRSEMTNVMSRHPLRVYNGRKAVVFAVLCWPDEVMRPVDSNIVIHEIYVTEPTTFIHCTYSSSLYLNLAPFHSFSQRQRDVLGPSFYCKRRTASSNKYIPCLCGT